VKRKTMGSDENVLIVEDEDEWHGIYERAVSSQIPEKAPKVAKDLKTAKRLIDEEKFAVAFVDIGLDVSDDENVDGLRVMEKIRAAGDETSIVVVTGRSGQDVLPITRDAIMKYGAYDTVGKSTVRPSEIRRLLAGGLEAYRSAAASGRMDAREALRGTADPMSWDYQAKAAADFQGDMGSFYRFLSQLYGEYLPLVPRPGAGHAYIDTENQMVHGNYWSRAVAAGVLICFGAEEKFDQRLEAVFKSAHIPEAEGKRTPAEELTGQGAKGNVFIIEENRRDEFSLG
jgi:ActR/RegA family two-component response regulator